MCKEKGALVFKSSFDEVNSSTDPYIEKLKELHINCHPVKALDFEFCNLAELSEKLQNHDQYDGIIFSSPRCVAAVEMCVGDLSQWKYNRAFVIGEKTAETVGIKLGLVPEGQASGNASNLASYILNQPIKKPLLLPCGDLAKETLGDILTQGNISLDKIVVYKTVPDPNLESSIRNILSSHKINFIVCFSPSSINFSLPLLKKCGINLSIVEWIAIGPSTENCLLKHKLKVGCVADKPTPESLAKAMKEFLG
ncbi:unnamed protein product [Nezara viridula]|uniref:Uroporphyrinogen-III synthase n=1 Tax=Nezara viridula TaxID=85310 RepID=A0A9P0HKH5_NEZVI|nr:unnamed protein product [Nezara viridula]